MGFALYGPDNATCTGTPAFTSTVPQPVGNGQVLSPSFTPTLAGTYRWVASYSGDANNGPAAGVCNAFSETRVVTAAAPSLTTTASADGPLGAAPLTDTATVTGRVSPVAGDTIDFRLYGPNDATCAGSPVFESLHVTYFLTGGTVTSAPFTPSAAGTYRWRATYSGDANNGSVAGACNAANETTVVAQLLST